MQFTTTREDMLAAVEFADGAVMSKPPVPVIAGLRLDANPEGMVTVSGFDFEQFAGEDVAADVTEPGAVLVNSESLKKIVKTLDKGVKVTVEDTDDGKVALVSGETRFDLTAMRLSDYPAMPDMPAERIALGLPALRLAELAPRITSTASRDKSLPILTGVSVEVVDDELRLRTTDRYRLAQADMGPHTGELRDGQAIVPASVWTWAGKAFKPRTKGEGDPGVTITADPGSESGTGFAAFECGNRRIICRTLDGEFVRTNSLWPDEHSGSVTLDAAKLEKATKRTDVIAGKYGPTRLGLDQSDRLTVRTVNEDGDTANERVPATVNGEPPAEIGFNSTYLREAANAVGGGEVSLRFTQSNKPAIVTGSDPAVTVLVMSMRLRENNQ